MTTITINLPDALAERVGGVARAVHRPVEEVLTAMLDRVAPSLDDVPEDMRAELVEMTWWEDARLMEAADATMPEEEQARMVELSADEPSSPAAQKELEALRTAYGQITLRKERATAMLSIRSGKRLLADADAA
jgi:predicted transcriptional regulator